MEPIEKCSGVYLIVNSVNGNSYVGSSMNVLKRVWAHFHSKKGSRIVSAAIRKHGIDHFFAFLLERVVRHELPMREAFWIDKLRPQYNATLLTNTGGKIVSEEQRQKISKSLRGRSLTEEHREKIKIGLTGRPCSSETRSKIGDGHRGKKHRPESIEKMRGSKHWTPERRAKISVAATGRIVSSETRSKKSLALKGKPWSAARRASFDLGFIDKHYKL